MSFSQKISAPKPAYNPRVVILKPAEVSGQKVSISDAELLRLWRILNSKNSVGGNNGKT